MALAEQRLAPLQGAIFYRSVPVVFAALRPPATVYQPSGLVSGESTIPTQPHGANFQSIHLRDQTVRQFLRFHFRFRNSRRYPKVAGSAQVFLNHLKRRYPAKDAVETPVQSSC